MVYDAILGFDTVSNSRDDTDHKTLLYFMATHVISRFHGCENLNITWPRDIANFTGVKISISHGFFQKKIFLLKSILGVILSIYVYLAPLKYQYKCSKY